MNNKNNLNDGLHFNLSDKLKQDLKNIYKPIKTLPPEIDKAIMDRANQKFAPKHWGHRILRHISIWRVAAAAAVIIFAFSLNLTPREGTTVNESLVDVRAVDIDENGRVDILDAFKLARYVESNKHNEKKWDINGDGLVDSIDVDLVASAAVRLPTSVPPVQKTRVQVDKGV